jgi:hypothetical protein
MDDEAVIVHATSLAGKAIVIKPELGVCFPRVLGDVGGLPEPRQERHVVNVLAKDPRSRGFR